MENNTNKITIVIITSYDSKNKIIITIGIIISIEVFAKFISKDFHIC